MIQDHNYNKAEGGIMELRARRAFGGIMDRVTGRRAYGLGSIFKSVGKAVSGVVNATKKVLKSDIGKMALMYAGGAYLGGSTMMGGAGGGFWSRMANPGNLMNLASNSKNTGLFNLASRAGGNLFGEDSILRKAGTSMVGNENDSFMDKAIRAAKWGGIGYGLSKTKLGEAPPNEESYMGDRANNKLIDPLTNMKSDPAAMTNTLNEALANAGGNPDKIAAINEAYRFLNDPRLGDTGAKSVLAANGGRIGYDEGGPAEIGDKNISDVLKRVQELEDEGLDFGAAMSQAMRELSKGNAQGGRIGYANAGKVDHEEDPLYINPDISYEDFPLTQFERDLRYMSKEERKEQLKLLKSVLKQRGNIGADLGMEGGEKTGIERQMELINFGTNIPDKDTGYKDNYSMKHRAAEYLNRDYFNENYETGEHYNQGGRARRAEGGLMDLGGMEKDYRAEGGFVPLGEYEKKDDVPARLSVNEFVFTADAVRGAGDGDIDKGAEIMENMMKNLEKGGTVSEESQGNTGAQQMFNISERLGEVV